MTINFLSPGVKSKQIRNGPVVAPGISTAIAGMMFVSARGPVGVPTQVTSPDAAAEIFGATPIMGQFKNSRMADSLLDFFNEGGSQCYVMRYIGTGSASGARTLQSTGAPSSGSLTSTGGDFPIGTLVNGDTFIGAVDGGGPLTATVHATHATKTGSGATYAAVTASHHLDVVIAGVPGTQVITFAGTENTQALFLGVINAALLGASAFNAAGQTELQTDIAGSSASGSIAATSSADVLTSLGLTAGAFTNAGPNNVATLFAVQASEVAAIFVAFTGSTTTFNTIAGTVTWTSNTTGPTSSVQFTGGTAVAKVAGFDNALHSGSASGANSTVTLTAAYGSGFASPGVWINGYSSQATQNNINVTTVSGTVPASTITTLKVASTARIFVGDTLSFVPATTAITVRGIVQSINGQFVTFTTGLVIPSPGLAGTESIVNEQWSLLVFDPTGLIVQNWASLRMSPLAGANYFVNVINGTSQVLVNATDLLSVASDPRPATDTNPVFFTGGNDGAAPLASDVVGYIPNWDKAKNVNFLGYAGLTTDFTGVGATAIAKAWETYVNNRADVMVCIDFPQGTPPGNGGGSPVDFVQNQWNLASSYEFTIWPWVKRLNNSNVVTLYPMSPHWLGIIARVHRTRNFGKAPAGIIDGQVNNILGLEFDLGMGDPLYDQMYPAGVNAVLDFPGQGFAVFGQNTLDATGEFGSVNIQTVFNINKRLVRSLTLPFVFEGNNTDTRASVTRVTTALLRQQRLAGILQGEKDADAFFIICNDTNNTPLVVASKKMIVRIGLAVTIAAEFIEDDFELDTQAISNQLASANA